MKSKQASYLRLQRSVICSKYLQLSYLGHFTFWVLMEMLKMTRVGLARGARALPACLTACRAANLTKKTTQLYLC